MTCRRLLCLLVAAATWIAPTLRGAELTVAAASNLALALEELEPAFRAQEPDIRLLIVTGASGNLVAQIQRGAPYDVFLSADLDFPRQLISTGRAEESTLRTFAVGRLVLWTTRPLLELRSLPEVLLDPRVRRIALAHPDHAPYGRAAREALQALGAWPEVEPKVVIGENIAQASQFTETGAADVGLVALSLVLAPRLRERGRWLAVSGDLHTPIEQAGVLTTRGAPKAEAQRFLAFLSSPAAAEILARWGYAPVAGAAPGAR